MLSAEETGLEGGREVRTKGEGQGQGCGSGRNNCLGRLPGGGAWIGSDHVLRLLAGNVSVRKLGQGLPGQPT